MSILSVFEILFWFGRLMTTVGFIRAPFEKMGLVEKRVKKVK